MTKLNKTYFCPIILGRTGAGKTKLIISLAKSMSIELIACDKFYSYAYFETSICRPKNDYEGIRVNLVGFRHPLEPLLDRTYFAELVNSVASNIVGRGYLPIAEGCSVGYISALLQDTKHLGNMYFKPIIGVKLPPNMDFVRFYQEKAINLISNGAIEEVENAIRQGWINSYVLKKSMLANPLLKYIQKTISIDTAIEIATKNFIRISEEEERKFETFPNVVWFEHTPGKTEEIAQSIHRLLIEM